MFELRDEVDLKDLMEFDDEDLCSCNVIFLDDDCCGGGSVTG